MQYTDDYIDLSYVTEISHALLFQVVGDVIKESNLSYVNRNSKKVVPKNTFYTRYGKRVLDIIISAIALLFTTPINLILLIITYFDVGTPVIFKQRRIGKDGREFTLIKFRNMTMDRNSSGELLPPNERVTQFGKFVRRTSLDELLNFWSIFKGDMSIIGPRPILTEYYERYSDRHQMRHAIRPGLECPVVNASQNRNTWGNVFENDVYYVENVSLILDIKMIISMFKLVFDSKEIATRGTAKRGSFMGYDIDGTSIDSHRVPIKYYEEAIKRIKADI